jgi:hypothetical protein
MDWQVVDRDAVLQMEVDECDIGKLPPPPLPHPARAQPQTEFEMGLGGGEATTVGREPSPDDLDQPPHFDPADLEPMPDDHVHQRSTG